MASSPERTLGAPDDDLGAVWMRQAGQTLEDHIRWEERVLFEAIQAGASPKQLLELASQTGQIRARRDAVCQASTLKSRVALSVDTC